MSFLVERIILIVVMALFMTEAAFVVSAQNTNTNSLDTPPYPISNQLNPAPEAPEQANGDSGEIHKKPAAVPNKNNVILYDPGTTRIDDYDEPSVPSNVDVTDSPNSGNTGITIPVPSSGGKGSR